MVFARVQSIVRGFLLGLSGTIFAYGQTGAGKTYSIVGGEQLQGSTKSGILPRALDFVFASLDPASTRLSARFFEIYNEKIFDLLGGACAAQPRSRRSLSRGRPQAGLELREEKDGSFSVPELRRVELRTLTEAYDWLEKGLQ